MKKIAYSSFVIIAIIAMLIYGKSVLIQFVFALLLWFLTKRIRQAIERIQIIKKMFPKWLKNIIAFFLIFMSLGFITDILINNINELSSSYSEYHKNIEQILNRLGSLAKTNLMETLAKMLKSIDYGSFFNSLANVISGALGNVFMVLIYAVFIFLEEHNFKEKLKKVFIKEDSYNKTNIILLEIETSISNYILLKTVVSLITGVLSYIVLAIVGVDAPVFWACLIFILNYIPTIGSLIATVFPAIFSLLQFGELWPFLVVLFAVGVIQIVVGNFIEPKIMGRSLNISPLVTILALAIWGKIWGITGMILCVPITVIMIITFSYFKSTKAIAVMLSEEGKFIKNK